MTPYDRICADVHGAIDNKQVKGIIHDLYHWDDNSKEQSVEGSFNVDDDKWINSKCSIKLIDKDTDNHFSPAMITTIGLTTLNLELDVTLMAITGSDDYSRETGHIVELLIESQQQIPESLLASIGTSTTLGALVELPDDFADYADFEIVIDNCNYGENGNVGKKSTIITGFLPAPKDGRDD